MAQGAPDTAGVAWTKSASPYELYACLQSSHCRQTGLIVVGLFVVQEAGLGRTIIARRLSAAKDLADWKDRRAARMSQVEELQVFSLLPAPTLTNAPALSQKLSDCAGVKNPGAKCPGRKAPLLQVMHEVPIMRSFVNGRHQ